MFDCELDDNFLIEAIENIEKSELDNCTLLSTPPDSKLFFDIGQRNELKTKTKFSPKKDFRSRLLQTLSKNEKKSDTLPVIESSNAICDKNENKIITPIKRITNEGTKRSIDDDDDDDDSYSRQRRQTSINTCNLALPSLKPSKPGPSMLSEQDQQYLEKRGEKYCAPSTAGCSRIIKQKAVEVPGSVVRKRKFPGPAGLLPTWAEGNNVSLNASSSESSVPETSFKEDHQIYSQTSVQDFVNGPWRQMLIDLELEGNNAISPPQTVNIRWLLRRAGLRGQAAVRKVPFLMVMIQSIDFTHIDATAVFRDTTGEIDGTISSGLLEKFMTCISSGAVLVLKDVTVLSPSFGVAGMRSIHKKHYLNVTLNSVLSIYSLSSCGGVIKTDNIKISKENLKLLVNNSKGSKEIRTVVEEEDERIEHTLKAPLFNNLGNPETRVQNTYHHSPHTPQNLSHISRGRLFNGDNIMKDSPLQFNHTTFNSTLHSTPKRDFPYRNKVNFNNKPIKSNFYDKKLSNSLSKSNTDETKQCVDRTVEPGVINKDIKSNIINSNKNSEITKRKPNLNVLSISNHSNPVDTNLFLDDDLDVLMASIDTNIL